MALVSWRTAAVIAMNMLYTNRRLVRGCLAALLLLLFRTQISAAEPVLAVVNAGVAQEDNGALAPHKYQFVPGEPLYVVFEIAGFGVKTDEEKDTRSISLTWEVSMLDQDNIPLAPAQSGEIKTGLSSEDKKWLPKRRAEFSLPSLVSAGEYRIHIAVKDLSNQTEAAKDIPFSIGGHKVEPARSVGVQRVVLSREEGGPDLEVPAYRPGDTVFVSFEIVGFSQAADHQYGVRYRFDVLAPDGKVFVKQAEAVQLSANSFYPAKFIPANFAVTAPGGSARGEYTVVLTVSDDISKQSSVTKRAFTLE